MTLIKWDESFSVGVKEVDRQHQRLIDLINQLHELMLKGQGKSALGAVLEDLFDYTKTHFGFEENKFKEFGYEHEKEHLLEHKKFVDKVLAFKSDFESGNAVLTIEIMNFLKDWLTNHIKGTDKKYTKCFNEHGLV